MKVINCEQGSPEWFEARLGVPTASEFSAILSNGRGGAPSKTRRTYMLKLAAEKISNNQSHLWAGNEHSQRGHEDEPVARELYEVITGNKVEQVGFVTNGIAGCSPDGLVGDEGGVEIKSKLGHLHLDIMFSNEVPSEHMAQILGSMWITGRKWWDFVSYSEGLPVFIKRVYRDEDEVKRIEKAVQEFNEELQHMIEKVRAYK